MQHLHPSLQLIVFCKRSTLVYSLRVFIASTRFSFYTNFTNANKCLENSSEAARKRGDEETQVEVRVRDGLIRFDAREKRR